MEERLRQIESLIALTYWQNHSHCGGDFDIEGCKGGDNGQCNNYDFCLAWAELRKENHLHKIQNSLVEIPE